MILLLTPFAVVVAFLLLAFRPLWLPLGYVLLVMLITAIRAFGHVAWINANVWAAPVLALVMFLPRGRGARS